MPIKDSVSITTITDRRPIGRVAEEPKMFEFVEQVHRVGDLIRAPPSMRKDLVAQCEAAKV